MADEEFEPLTAQKLSESLTDIQPVVGGGGFAFTKMDCSDKDPKINHLGNKLEDCEHLRYVIISKNQVRDITAVSRLPHLLSLQADENAIESISCLDEAPEDGTENSGTNLPWCQHIDLSTNKLTEVPSLARLGRLRFLRLIGNEISSLQAFGEQSSLEELELQSNKLTNLLGLGPCDRLRSLNVSEQTEGLVSLEGLNAANLVQLIAKKNKLATLDHIDGAPRCSDLDVEGNELAAPAEDKTMPEEFIKLGERLPELQSLTISENPVGGLKLELICCVKQLIKIDGELVTEEQRTEAVERDREIKEAEEERRKAAEEAAEAARKAAEEGEPKEE